LKAGEYNVIRLARQPVWRLWGESSEVSVCVEIACPHPSPLPEGEGTDWGIFESYVDLNGLAESIIAKLKDP